MMFKIDGRIFHGFFLFLVSLLIGLSTGCSSNNFLENPASQRIAVMGALLIDGHGGEPLMDAVILINNGYIEKVGRAGNIDIPGGTRILDLGGSTILPGFINAHVHYGFSADNLKAWASGGVTTVRDEGLFSNHSIEEKLAWRKRIMNDPAYARLVTAGQMITVPGGYGSLTITSPENARQVVLDELLLGFDQIKVSLEDGYAGESGLARLTSDELAVIVETAHQAGTRVSGHITQAAYIKDMLDAGVDDIAHIAYDPISPDVIQRMVANDVILIPTFTVFRNYGASLDGCSANLRHFVNAGGKVALGNDYGGGPADFELGIPMFEIEMMTSAGMTPMEIIQAGTYHAAITVGLEKQIGTIETGKIADILVIAGNPLEDLRALKNIRLVIHNGTIITPISDPVSQ
jgi:imidazolonepropionase-like amidohydrolase